MREISRENGRVKYSYAVEKFPLADLVARMFSVDSRELSCLHEQARNHYSLFTKMGSEVDTEFHKTYYGHINPVDGVPTSLGEEFLATYQLLLQDIQSSYFQEDIYVQCIPNFRIHLPKNRSVARKHKDSDAGHLVQERNIFLPLTSAKGSATIWAESSPKKGDFTPLDATVGELIEWDGANLLHYNQENLTGFSRVSIDFRVIPVAEYIDVSGKPSLSTKTKICVGDYFREL